MLAIQLWPPRAARLPGTIEAALSARNLMAEATRRTLARHAASVRAGVLGGKTRQNNETKGVCIHG